MLFNKLLAPMQRRLATLISRCTLKNINSSSGVQQARLAIYADEEQEKVEYLEPYGFTSMPHPEAEGLVVNIGAQRGACVALNLGNRQYRFIGLKTGELALYTDEKDYLLFERGNKVSLFTKNFTVNAQHTHFSGSLTTTGGIVNTGGTVSSNGIVLDSHVHSGVTPGGGTTGAPV